MKRVIRASNEFHNQLPITQLTPDQLMGLPDRFLCKADRGPQRRPEFGVVDKRDISKNPNTCFYLRDKGAYAYGEDVYIAKRNELDEYAEQRQRELDYELSQYKNYLI